MIAISYRREDSLPIAGRLYDRLQAKFGKKNVFMDFDSIPPGADFRQHIKQMIERSKLVIAIIGPHWLGEQPNASRRIDNPADFVRLEIAYALEGGIPVIPLLINTTQMPKPEMLPPDIQELAFRHALPLDSGMDFHSHVDRLIAGIGKATDAARERRRFVTDSEKARPASPTTHVPRTSGSDDSKRKLIAWTRSKLVAGTVVALLFAVGALVAWYVDVHRREPASAESATTAPLIVKPSVEQSVSPLPLGSQAPKEAALTTAPSPTAVEVRKAKRLESEEKAASSPASTAVQTQRDSRPIYVVIASVSKTVNIRSDHSARSTIIEKLRPGDRVFLEDGRVPNDDPPSPVTWQKVTTMNGATGWIDFVYLAPEQSSPPQLVSEQPKSIVEQSSQPQITLSVGSNVNSVAFSRDGTRIVTGNYDHTAKVWDAQSGKELLTLSVGSNVYSVAFSPDGTRISAGTADPTARVWDAQSGKELLTLKGHSYSVNSVAFSPDGRRILTGSTDDTARVWDAQSGKELLTLSVGANVYSVAFSPNGMRTATGSADATTRVWDAQSGKELLTLKGHSYSVNSVAFSPDGSRIATGSADATAKVWDAQSGKELLTLKGHSSSVYSVAFSPNGTRIATGGADATAKVWEFGDREPLLPLPLASVQPKPVVKQNSQPETASVSPNGPGAQKLTRVYVKKYGVSALLPTDVFPDAKKLSNSDQSFLQGNSWTGQTTVTFSSVHEPLAKVYAECATEHSPQAPSKTVQYKVLKPTWFVVSGDLGPEADASLGFYTKGVKKDGFVVIMHFQWREDDFPFSEETFTAMSRGFDGN